LRIFLLSHAGSHSLFSRARALSLPPSLLATSRSSCSP
jgi:hypothetical protein